MIKRYIRSIHILIIIIIIFGGCRPSIQEEKIFTNTASDFNFLNLRETGFNLNGSPVYALDIPYPFLHEAFLNTNYFLVKDKIVYSMGIYKHCEEFYKVGKYRISWPLDSRPLQEFQNCDIGLSPIIDFAMSPGDTFTLLDHYIFSLSNKFYDPSIQDTAYKFIRNGHKDEIGTVIYASPNIGFISVYDTVLGWKEDKVINSIGKPYNLNYKSVGNVKMQKPSIDLKFIKELKQQ